MFNVTIYVTTALVSGVIAFVVVFILAVREGSCAGKYTLDVHQTAGCFGLALLAACFVGGMWPLTALLGCLYLASWMLTYVINRINVKEGGK